MFLTIKRVGLLSDQHLPLTMRPRKGVTVIVYVENPCYSYPKPRGDYKVAWCTSLGGKRWVVRSDYADEPPPGARAAIHGEVDFLHDLKNVQVQHSLDEIEFSPKHALLYAPEAP